MQFNVSKILKFFKGLSPAVGKTLVWGVDGSLENADLASGPKGDKGDTGAKGNDGADGLSAYEVAVSQGFIGTEAEWLLSLKGNDGVDGVNGVDGNTFIPTPTVEQAAMVPYVKSDGTVGWRYDEHIHEIVDNDTVSQTSKAIPYVIGSQDEDILLVKAWTQSYLILPPVLAKPCKVILSDSGEMFIAGYQDVNLAYENNLDKVFTHVDPDWALANPHYVNSIAFGQRGSYVYIGATVTEEGGNSNTPVTDISRQAMLHNEFFGWGNDPDLTDPSRPYRFTLTAGEYARLGYNSTWFTGSYTPDINTPAEAVYNDFYLKSNGDVYVKGGDNLWHWLVNVVAIEAHTHAISDITGLEAAISGKADLVNGVIPANQLPSYVDDVLEYTDVALFPATGEASKIYVDTTANTTYRWSGTQYVQIGGGGVALGETAATAYRGDRGKTAYDHSQSTGNPHGTTKANLGLENVDNTSDLLKPISNAVATALTGKASTIHATEHAVGGSDPIFANRWHGVQGRVSRLPLPTHITTSTFTLATAATPLPYYNQGVKTNVTVDKSVVLGAAGYYFIYFNAAGVLTVSTSFPGLEPETGNVLIAACLWNGVDYGLVFDERHGYDRDHEWHNWAHNTVGTRYGSGLDQLTLTGTGATSSMTYSSGNIWDEDINFAIGASSAFPTANGYRVFYQTGATSYTFLNNPVTTAGYFGANGRPNVVNSTGYVLTQVANATNRYVNFFVYAAPDNHTPIYIFVETMPNATVGAGGYTSVALARAVLWPNLSGLGLSQEMKPLYRLVVRADGQVQAATSADDYRTSSSLPQSAGVSSTSAATVSFAPAGNISSATVQSAIEELDAEKLNLTMLGAALGAAPLGADSKVPVAYLPAIAAGGNIIATATAASDAVTTLTITGLDLNSHGGVYILRGWVKLLTTGGGVVLKVNGDGSATGYNTQVLYGNAAVPTSAATANSSAIAGVGPSGTSYFEAKISVANGFLFVVSQEIRNDGLGPQYLVYKASVTNVTSITLTAPGTFATGSNVAVSRADLKGDKGDKGDTGGSLALAGVIAVQSRNFLL